MLECWYSYKNADGFFEDAEDFEVRVGCAVYQDRHGVESDEGRHVKGSFTLARNVCIHIVEDAVAEIRLLVKGSLCCIALSAREEGQESLYDLVSLLS